MQEKRYNDAKKEIRSVLLTYQSSITLEEFLTSYKSLLGERLPSRALGFSTDVQFLKSMPDVVNVCTNPHGKVLLTGIADEASEHIQKLVSKQRKSQQRGSKSTKNFQRPRISDTSPIIKEQPFLPGTLRAEILKVMDMFHDGAAFSTFAVTYHKIFKKYLPLVRGLGSLEGMISLIPELEIKSINNEKIICFTNDIADNNHLKISDTRKNISPLGQTTDKDNEKVLLTDSVSPNIHKSGVTVEVQKNFEMLLKECPEGILDVHLPPLYENLTKKSFDLHELGYTSVLELVDALPHIFKRVLNPEKGNNWIILPALRKVNDFSFDSSSKKFQVGIPSDAASSSLQFIKPTMPQDLRLNQYVPVFVSAIVNPTLFWFQFQMDDTIKEFEKFENEMGYFYDCYAGSKYIMHDSDIAIGATCIICYPEDKKWYRAIIKSIPSSKFVNVLFVDYGSRDNVPRNNLYYVRNQYHKYPAHAFKAQLAGLKPPKNATTWDIKAQQRFIQLCDCVRLMAFLNPVDEDMFSAYLCDTSGDSDIHLNDTLINEGYAEICFENQFNRNGLEKNCEVSVSNRVSSDTDYFSSESSEHIQNVTPDSLPDPEMFNPKQKLLFSPKEQVDGVKSNPFHGERIQESKRFVKQVHLCEDYKIHVINIEEKLFMSCAELSRLLWSEKDSSFLIERLKYKEVNIPFLKLSKQDFVPLFEQCICYKIPEYEKLKPSNSSLILYTAENAFDVLNVFGHPSICLRLAIKNEIISFDPRDPIWKEFDHDKLIDQSDIDKDIEEQLNKLCLYDLKAKNEALKIKKIKLLRIKNDSAAEETKNIDKIQNAIERRMKKN